MSINPDIDDRRVKSVIDVAEHFNNKKKSYYNSLYNVNIIKIFAGDYYVSDREDVMLSTILGSCVSACIRDTVARVGGMNHFLLPGDAADLSATSDAARYGVYAMESLINGILKAGGQKHRLEVKVFGGGNVINNSAKIGSKNAMFVREFLHNEGFKINSEDLEGDNPRSLHYYPASGKVMMRKLYRKEDFVVVQEEEKFVKQFSKASHDGDIELF